MQARPIDRLTEREKDCLRRWLAHQTAKEMALDLGISPHAVEKRLKMARAKLGVSSSLDAARLMAAAEGYQQAGPQPSDLEAGAAEGQKRIAGPLILGGITMALIAATLVTLATLAPQTVATQGSGGTVPGPNMRKATMNEVGVFLSAAFETFDKDDSGFLDRAEVSTLEPRDGHRDPTLNAAPANGQPDPAAEAKWMAKLDTDRDGRVSRDEYVNYMMPWMLLQGIPKDWKAPQTPAD